MQLGLPFGPRRSGSACTPTREAIVVGRRSLVITYVRHRRARHYIVRVEDDASLRVTIPRGGSREQAERFVREKAGWIDRQRYRMTLRRVTPRWHDGTSVLVRGRQVPIEIVATEEGRFARVDGRLVPLPPGATGTIAAVERHLRRVAAATLPSRLLELAAGLGRTVGRVTVRAQRTRWASCSPAGRISLNWRLVQMPDSVRDYVLLHELTHLIHLDHSRRFWREMERVCPWHREARAWLKVHARAG